jgi:hypothetical protein
MAAIYVETREIPLDQLTQLPGNARRGDIPVIKASLTANGQYRALTVRDTGDALVILVGNNTYQAICELGRATTARCEVITCTDAEAKRIALVDNRSSDLADYDTAALVALLRDADDFAATGYTGEDVTALLAADEAEAHRALYRGQDDAGWGDPDPREAAPASPATPPAPVPGQPAPMPGAGPAAPAADDDPELAGVPAFAAPERQQSEGASGDTTTVVRIGKMNLRITDQEIEALLVRYRWYLHEHTTDWGFLLWLSEGRPM